MSLPTAHEIAIAILIKVFCTLAAEEHEQRSAGVSEGLAARSALLHALNRFLLDEVQSVQRALCSTLLQLCERLHSHVSSTSSGTDESAAALQIVDRLQAIVCCRCLCQQIRACFDGSPAFTHPQLQDVETPDDLFDLFVHFESLLLAPNETVSALVPYATTIHRSAADGVPVMLVHPSSTMGLFIRRLHLSFEKLRFEEVSRLTLEVRAYVDESTAESDAQRGGEADPDGPDRFASPLLAESYIFDLVRKIETEAHNRPAPDGLLRLIVSLERAYFSVAKVHYLRYLYHRDRFEWQPAVDSLYRYFDMCYCDVDRDGNHRLAKDMLRSAGVLSSYCLLNLAALHSHFGHYDAALEALHGLISNAHERSEHECLLMAFALLFRISQAAGVTRESTLKLVQRCVAKAKELAMYELASEAHLALADLSSFLGDRITPPPPPPPRSSETENHRYFTALHVWRELRESAHINAEHGPLLSQISTESFRSVAWHRFGNKRMAADCGLALQEDRNQLDMQCNMAIHLCTEGHYAQAIRVLANAGASQHRGRADPNWLQALYGIAFDRSLRCAELEKAEAILQLLDEITSYPSGISVAGGLVARMDVFLDRKAQLLIRRGRVGDAKRTVEHCVDTCMRASEDLLCVKFLHRLAELYMTLGTPERALGPLAQARAICERVDAISMHAQTTLLQIEAMMLASPNNFNEAEQRLETTMQHVLQNGYPLDRGRAFSLRALCQFHKWSQQQAPDRIAADEVAHWLHRALCEYERAGSLLDAQRVLRQTVDLWNAVGADRLAGVAAHKLAAVTDQLRRAGCLAAPLQGLWPPTVFLEQEMKVHTHEQH